VGRDEHDDEPKGFLEEVFEHRQRLPEPAEETGPIDETADPDDDQRVAAGAPADATATGRVAPITDAGDDPAHPGAVPGAGAAGGSGVVAEELGSAVDVAAPPVARELDGFERALIDEAMKKSGLVWIDVGAGPIAQSVWYVWLDGAAYLLTGHGEQPDAGLATASAVTVSARSKETRTLLVEWVGTPNRVPPDDPDWDEVTAALAKARLNLPDPASAPDRWAQDPSIAVYRLVPTGPLTAAPGRFSDSSRRATPVPTGATTAGPPPKVLHRRQTARRPLS
jgi:hypothetical protein